MFEQVFKNVDDVLWKEAGCTTELDYTEQTSWLLFLKYLDALEQDKADEAALKGKKASYILEKPGFFRDEAELRALWSDPETRRKLLEGLAERGFGHEQLAEMQRIIDAEKSDLFDVLAHVAYAMPPLTREERANQAKASISVSFAAKQQAFLDFVLSHYVSAGVDELDPEKLTPLLRLRYRDSIADAIADLGRPEEIGKVFAGFQRFLYERAA